MIKLEGIIVKHKVFGEGAVTVFDKKYITIQFVVKTIKFAYPDAFEKFIKAENAEIQEAIINDIFEAKSAEAKIREVKIAARNAEEERKVIEMQNVSSTTKKIRNIDDGFDENYHVAHLARNPILTYQEVEEQFTIKIAGFGRGINKTPSSVVLISSIDKKKSGFVYHDKWTTDGDYIYSGEGKNGDQSMTSGNRVITSATDEGKTIHLFVKFSPQEYYYQGIFGLVDYTYENDLDESGNTRKEYKFRLRKVN